jgi:hypothetical protein
MQCAHALIREGRHITLAKTARKLDIALDTRTALLTTNWI